MEQMLEEMKNNQFTTEEVARHFRVKRHIVDKLAKNETSGVNTLAKIAGDFAQEMTTRSLIENEVRRFLWSGHHIWSVASVTAEISQKQGC